LQLEDGVEVLSRARGRLVVRTRHERQTSSTIGLNASIIPRKRLAHELSLYMISIRIYRNVRPIWSDCRAQPGQLTRSPRPRCCPALSIPPPSSKKWSMVPWRLIRVRLSSLAGAYSWGASRGSARFGFATRVGFVAPAESRLLLIVENETDLREACTRLALLATIR